MFDGLKKKEIEKNVNPQRKFVGTLIKRKELISDFVVSKKKTNGSSSSKGSTKKKF